MKFLTLCTDFCNLSSLDGRQEANTCNSKQFKKNINGRVEKQPGHIHKLVDIHIKTIEIINRFSNTVWF